MASVLKSEHLAKRTTEAQIRIVQRSSIKPFTPDLLRTWLKEWAKIPLKDWADLMHSYQKNLFEFITAKGVSTSD